jgi:hypothetical protein
MEHVLLPPKYREAGVKLIDTGAARHFSSQTFFKPGRPLDASSGHFLFYRVDGFQNQGRLQTKKRRATCPPRMLALFEF